MGLESGADWQELEPTVVEQQIRIVVLQQPLLITDVLQYKCQIQNSVYYTKVKHQKERRIMKSKKTF